MMNDGICHKCGNEMIVLDTNGYDNGNGVIETTTIYYCESCDEIREYYDNDEDES